MKKNFITPFAMMLFMAFTFSFTLTGCGEEVEKKITGPTEFISETETGGTRTSMDDERYFYWEPGDNIYINTEGTTWVRSDDNTIEGNAQATCKFIFNNTFTKAGYPVVYTGNDTTSTSATEVKIAPVQKQKSWNNAEHFGASGDCGTATAAKQDNGTYKFSLRHKAAYLKLQPYYDDTNMPGGYRISKIEITTRKNTTTLSGTYDFTHADGIATTPKTAAETDTIVTLICGDNGFPLGTSAMNSIFVVINPNASGAKHAVTIKYFVVPEASSPYSGTTFEFSETVTAKEFKPNGVTTIAHQLTLGGDGLLTYDPDFYMWDAPVGETWYYGMTANYNTTPAPVIATRSCKDIPNSNAMSWYVNAGDPRWDNTTRWMIKGSPQVYTGGVWIKRRMGISGFNSNVGYGGINHLETSAPISNTSTTYMNGGKPANNVIINYFFLPALGRYADVPNLVNTGATGYYWVSSTYRSDGDWGATLYFHKDGIAVYSMARSAGQVAEPSWFK